MLQAQDLLILYITICQSYITFLWSQSYDSSAHLPRRLCSKVQVTSSSTKQPPVIVTDWYKCAEGTIRPSLQDIWSAKCYTRRKRGYSVSAVICMQSSALPVSSLEKVPSKVAAETSLCDNDSRDGINRQLQDHLGNLEVRFVTWISKKSADQSRSFVNAQLCSDSSSSSCRDTLPVSENTTKTAPFFLRLDSHEWKVNILGKKVKIEKKNYHLKNLTFFLIDLTFISNSVFKWQKKGGKKIIFILLTGGNGCPQITYVYILEKPSHQAENEF